MRNQALAVHDGPNAKSLYEFKSQINEVDRGGTHATTTGNRWPRSRRRRETMQSKKPTGQLPPKMQRAISELKKLPAESRRKVMAAVRKKHERPKTKG